MDACPYCGGPLEVLGTLGNVVHGRCRNCGAVATIDDEGYTRGP